MVSTSALLLKANPNQLLFFSKGRHNFFHNSLHRMKSANFISCSNKFTGLQVKCCSLPISKYYKEDNTAVSFNNESQFTGSTTSKEDCDGTAAVMNNTNYNLLKTLLIKWLKIPALVMLHSLFLMTITMNHRDTAALAVHSGGSGGGCVILFSSGPPMYIENCDHIKDMAALGKSETVDDDHPMEEEKRGLNLYETFCMLCMLFFVVQTITVLQDYWSKRYYTKVIKLQVGLDLGEVDFETRLDCYGLHIESRLKEIIAESCPLNFKFKDTLRVLKSRSPCWVAGYSSMKVSKSMEDGETYFNQLLSEERSKVGDLVETDLVNQSSSKNWSKVKREALVNSLDGSKSRKRVYVHRDTHTVVTVLVAATNIENFYVPKTIDYKNQLYDFLTELQSISKTADILALEVICNPPNEKDVKSVEELQKEYPQLFTISDYSEDPKGPFGRPLND